MIEQKLADFGQRLEKVERQNRRLNVGEEPYLRLLSMNLGVVLRISP